MYIYIYIYICICYIFQKNANINRIKTKNIRIPYCNPSMSLSHRQIPYRKSHKQIPHNYITMGFLKWGYPKSWMVHNFIMGQQKNISMYRN